jgi:hypothetical protein
MIKLRIVSTGACALALCAAPATAVAAAATPALAEGAITSDTTFKIGKKARLKLMEYGDQPGEKKHRVPVDVRVVKIEKGKPADLKGSGLPASTTGMVPWYIRSEIGYAGADFTSIYPSFRGGFSDGSSATSVYFNKKIGSCEETSGPKLNKKQRTVRSCNVVLAPPGVPVDRASTYYSVSEHRSVTVTWKK